MSKYAQFDSSVQGASPVVGWFDTDIFQYPNLPDASDLIELSDAEWATHFSNPSGWMVNDGKLIQPESI